MGAGDFHLPSSQHGDPTKRNRLISPPNGPKRLVYPLLLKGIALLQKTLILKIPHIFLGTCPKKAPDFGVPMLN